MAQTDDIQRRIAEQQFMISLEQFRERLETPDNLLPRNYNGSSSSSRHSPQRNSATLTMTDLEQAIADIDQFLQARQQWLSEA